MFLKRKEQHGRVTLIWQCYSVPSLIQQVTEQPERWMWCQAHFAAFHYYCLSHSACNSFAAILRYCYTPGIFGLAPAWFLSLAWGYLSPSQVLSHNTHSPEHSRFWHLKRKTTEEVDPRVGSKRTSPLLTQQPKLSAGLGFAAPLPPALQLHDASHGETQVAHLLP